MKAQPLLSELPRSLDFPPERISLTAQEIAQRLTCSPDHIANLIRDGAIVRGKSKAEAALLALRVSVEDYRGFLRKRCTSKKPNFEASSIPWPSLDFPDTGALTPAEIGKVLDCTTDHIISLIAEDSLTAFDLKGAGSQNNYYRVPVEAYRLFINERATGARYA